MDDQGWRLEVIEGANRLLSSHHVPCVFAEAGFRRDVPGVQHFAEMNDIVEQSGFRSRGL